MARKKVASEPALKSWDEVDDAMRQIAESQSCLDEIELDMNRKITAAKDEAATLAAPAQERIKKLEVYIKDFVTEHRSELSGKTRAMNFGKTGFRISTKLIIPASVGDIIAKLRAVGLQDCITVKESVNKDTLKQKPTETILQTGAYLKQTDEFWYELNKDSLKAAEQ